MLHSATIACRSTSLQTHLVSQDPQAVVNLSGKGSLFHRNSSGQVLLHIGKETALEEHCVLVSCLLSLIGIARSDSIDNLIVVTTKAYCRACGAYNVIEMQVRKPLPFSQ
ncbi:hypothetical protein PS691_01971 [Pseudomonas fluorescens]|uniref:Uncharacterized protein n=1 Tax=Pseudomonas fluorescens TaxID=294 RepID=A0A5E7BRU6_PSEFL|nr:hypothetical protein PS691_01971 [Pseudomonas fluorescens]